MARQEHDREDLMAEATALVERVELLLHRRVGGPQPSERLEAPNATSGPSLRSDPATRRQQPVVAGFWRDGRCSIYFGGDPVYHFAPEGELRKAFVGGKIYRTARGGLSQLTRRRAAERTSELVRRDLPSDETDRLLNAMHQELRALDAAFSKSAVQVVREHPPDAGVADKVRRYVHCLITRPPRLAPPIGRR